MKTPKLETKAANGTAVVKKDENPLAEYDMASLEADAGMGTEGMGVGDLKMPYLYILQTNSPQVNPGHQSYVEGAQASMFYNVANKRYYDGRETGLLIVDCGCERKYVEWKDREKTGGGWVGEHTMESDILEYCEKDEKGRWFIPQTGNMIVETAYHYCLYFCPDTKTWEKCVIPMKSTALKMHRELGTMIAEAKLPSGSKAPRFLNKFLMTTYLEQKNNNSWWQFDFEKAGMVTPDVYQAAKDFYQMIIGGKVERKPEGANEEMPF